MRWQMGRRSTNVEDRRGMSGGLMIGGGGSIIVLLIAMLLGVDPRALLQQTQVQTPQTQAPTGTPSDEAGEFVAVILGETEAVWEQEFQKRGQTYTPPHLVLFNGQVQSACGFASAAVGPFYCPEDQRVYLDTEFFRLLDQRLGAPGDFAQAYVIAHEVGHHVQNLMGITQKMQALRGRVSETEYNRMSVRLELQADFLAGVWAHYTSRKDMIEEGDIDEALQAASAIGDDKLQQESQGRVVPDSFTHGTSEQRVRWFRLGYETGELERGDTFGTEAP